LAFSAVLFLATKRAEFGRLRDPATVAPIRDAATAVSTLSLDGKTSRKLRFDALSFPETILAFWRATSQTEALEPRAALQALNIKAVRTNW
jgi:hypothetical protein